MTTDQFFGEEKRSILCLEKKLRNSVAYTREIFNSETKQQELHSQAIRRNNKWRDDFQTFINTNSSKTEDGRLNNSFYRKKQLYDVVIPYNIYSAIMDYLFYSIENQVVEDVTFICKNIDSIMTFCHMVDYYNQRYMSYHYSRRKKTPLAVKLIYSFIGREYTKVVSFLEKIDVLDSDKMYIPAKWDKRGNQKKKGLCRHYQFAVEKDDRYCVHQVTSRRIISRLQSSTSRFDEIEYINENANTVKDRALNDYFSKHFDLDESAFEDRSKDYDGFNYYTSKISSGEKKLENFTIGRDKFGNRLYHPFLNMKKELRNHITINGSLDTSVVDINNSHPYFFSLLFDSTFMSYISHMMTEDEANIFTAMSVDPAFSEQISLFSKITASGNYYNFLRDNIKTERDLKELNMYYFYGKFNKRNAIYRFFDKNFNFINIVKHRLIKLSGYKRLCQLLQRIEAHVMIDKVFYNLKNAGLSILPLHDAIMCQSSDSHAVKEEINRVFDEIGIGRPVFNKQAEFHAVLQAVETIRKKNFNLFLNKNIVFEELNQIIKSVGIKNRVFKEGMRPEAVCYIDQRFEDVRHLVADDLAGKYYELRIIVDSDEFNKFDFTELYPEYKESELAKKKFYTRDVIAYVKVNPAEFLNHVQGTNYKTRVTENSYIY